VKIIACDQSLTGTALVGLENGREFLRQRITTPEEMKGFERIEAILTRVASVLDTHDPDVFVMEDYSGGANLGTMIKLCELGGCIKLTLHQRGFVFGTDAIRSKKRKVVLIQSAQGIKKFCLGHGTLKKDSGYLLKVFDRLNQRFDSDDEADAYMHAWMGGIVVKILQGEVKISDLHEYQQEALISEKAAKKAKLSKARAMKLPDSEKVKLISF
jgi:Holliday junction resolvasome RuvABC endonuclease subunit